MNDKNHPVCRLRKHVDEQGIEGLLPQNLPDDILELMLLEVDAVESGKIETVPASLLIMTILQLHFKKKLPDEAEIEIGREEMMGYFTLYAAQLKLEELRRCGNIIIDESTLPTVDNIFIASRIMGIMQKK